MFDAEREAVLEEAARLCDRNAALYASYALRERTAAATNERPLAWGTHVHTIRAQEFDRDEATCAEMARLIRALKDLPPEERTPDVSHPPHGA